MDKKYEFTGNTIAYEDYNGEHILHQIRSVRDIYNESTQETIPAGTVGRYIESEESLSHEGGCWAEAGTQITHHAKLKEDAMLRDNAVLRHYALVKGCADISNHAIVCGNSLVSGEAKIEGNAILADSAKVYGRGIVGGNARISGHAEVFGNAVIGIDKMAEELEENYRPKGFTKVSHYAKVHGDSLVFEDAKVEGKADISGDACVREQAFVGGNAKLSGTVVARGDSVIVGNKVLTDGVVLESTPEKFTFQRPSTSGLKPVEKPDDRVNDKGSRGEG